MSANLDAEVISTVQKNKAELEKFVIVPSQKLYQVEKKDEDPFEKIISKVTLDSEELPCLPPRPQGLLLVQNGERSNSWTKNRGVFCRV